LTGHLGGIVSALVGLVVGQLYVFDVWGLKSYRLGPTTQAIGRGVLLPLIGAMRPPRRTNRAVPEDDEAETTPQLTEGTQAPAQGEPVEAEPEPTENPRRTHVVREWVNQLAGRETVLIRQPTQDEVNQVTRMFPNLTQQAVTTALQRSPSTQAAVELLLERNRSTT
jgi:hypothetical protein